MKQMLLIAAQALSVGALVIGLLAVLGYLFSSTGPLTWGFPPQMALPTALGIILNSVSALLLARRLEAK